MRQFLSLLLLTCWLAGRADTEFFGMFLQGQQIGVVTSTSVAQADGSIRTATQNRIGAKVLGQGMAMSISSESVSREGKLIRQSYVIESAGRMQKVQAEYLDNQVRVIHDSDGSVTRKVLEVPKGALLIDDPTFGLFGKGLPELGTKLEFYIFDPMTLTLIKNEAEFLGSKQVTMENETYTGNLLRVKDPRATSDIYFDSQGKVILVTSLFGIYMKPISREQAVGSTYLPSIDLATVSRIVPNRKIESPETLRSLSLRIESTKPLPLKNDGYWQTTKRTGDATTVTITPPAQTSKAPLSELSKSQARFLKPALYIPSDDPQFIQLAAQITKGSTSGFDAARKIVKHVHRIMRPNAGIGVLRSAKEILKSREGVCRDYAILAATLLRAAKIPTKLVTGAVYADEAFYYHAWVEVWDGKMWIALDPTIGGDRAGAAHIKFTEGEPETAFVIFTLDGAKITILSETRRSN